MSEGIDQPHRREINTAELPPIKIEYPDLKRLQAVGRARDRVRAVANGGFINTTYGKGPVDALAEFRADLRVILGEGSPPRG